MLPENVLDNAAQFLEFRCNLIGMPFVFCAVSQHEHVILDVGLCLTQKSLQLRFGFQHHIAPSPSTRASTRSHSRDWRTRWHSSIRAYSRRFCWRFFGCRRTGLTRHRVKIGHGSRCPSTTTVAQLLLDFGKPRLEISRITSRTCALTCQQCAGECHLERDQIACPGKTLVFLVERPNQLQQP